MLNITKSTSIKWKSSSRYLSFFLFFFFRIATIPLKDIYLLKGFRCFPRCFFWQPHFGKAVGDTVVLTMPSLKVLMGSQNQTGLLLLLCFLLLLLLSSWFLAAPHWRIQSVPHQHRVSLMWQEVPWHKRIPNFSSSNPRKVFLISSYGASYEHET